MPDTINSVAVDASTINTGLDGTTAAVTNATATSSSTSVDGIAAANAKATEATGIQDSLITAGQNQTITATEDASVTATAGSIGKVVATATTESAKNVFKTGGNHNLRPGNTVTFSALSTGSGLSTANEAYRVVSTPSSTEFTLELATFPSGLVSTTAELTSGTIASFIGGATAWNIPTNTSTTQANNFFKIASDDISVGDAITFGTTANGLTAGTVYYVTSVDASGSDTNFQISTIPGGTPISMGTYAITSQSATDIQESTASAYFTSDAGAITDTVLTDIDISAGETLTIGATANNTATATATNVESDALANANLLESVGLQNTGVSAGEDGSITANVDGDAIASATTTGTSTTGGDATALATATKAIAIDDVGDYTSSVSDFSFGTAATITANVGTSADRVTVGTTASTATGAAVATSTLGSNVGISEGDTGVIQVGTTGTVTAGAFNATNASATTVNGAADADATITNASGIDMATGAKLLTGQGAVVTGTANTSSTVVASAVTGAATADSVLTETSGAEIGIVSAGTSGTITGTATASLSASATSVDAAATALANNIEADAVELTNFTAGTTAAVTGTTNSTIAATAGSTDSDATATAKTPTGTGVSSGGTFTVGTSAALSGTTTLNQTAAATSIGDSAALDSSSATVGSSTQSNYGLELGTGNTTIGTSATITGAATATNSATATGTAADATALVDISDQTGIDLDTTGNRTLSTGTSAAITAQASGTNTGTATSVSSNATSTIDVDRGNALGDGAGTITTGTSASISAAANFTNTATATTTTGLKTRNLTGTMAVDGTIIPSGNGSENFAVGDAINFSTATAGVGASGGPDTTTTYYIKAINANGSFTIATVSATGTTVAPTAGTYTLVGTESEPSATSGADATITNDAVTGIDVTSITSGTTLTMAASSSSTQTANASNVGTSGTNYKNDATATVAGTNSISGIDDTTISVGTNTTAFTATANLAGSAISNTTFGDATSTAGLGSTVSGLTTSVADPATSNTLIVGQDAVGGLNLAATTTLSALANTVWEGATATVGTTTATSIGNDQVDITVGRDAGTILTSSTNVLTATAATIGDLVSGTADVASAVINQEAAGTKDAKIIIGNDGNLTSIAASTGNARATNVGDSADTDLSSASLTLDVRGLNEVASTSDVTIGADGNVQSQAQASGSAFAQNVNGAEGTTSSTAGAYSIGNLDVYGTSLQNAGADISIGSTGNITGLAIVGTLNTGVLGNQVSVTSTTTEGTSIAVGQVDTAGIKGTSDNSVASTIPGVNQSLLTAGPVDGDVIGQSITGMAVLANTIGSSPADDASSTMTATIAGLQNVDILGGQTGVNLIKGTSTGDYDSTAITIKGDATAVGDVTGYGIFSASAVPGDITTSGNIQAISNLLNTVVASSVAGSATATATTTAVGLGNYNVTILGSGALTANATGLAESTSSSVAGRAAS